MAKAQALACPCPNPLAVTTLSQDHNQTLSTSSRHPNEYDAVMGITQVDSREDARFEEGVEPDFQDAVEEAPIGFLTTFLSTNLILDMR